MSGPGFLPSLTATATNSAPATNQFVEIFSDHYELRTNRAFFGEAVRVHELVGEKIHGKMNCSSNMTVTFTGTNQVQQMVADGKVVIEKEDKGFTGGKAVYTGGRRLVELTGDPNWRKRLCGG